MSRIALGADHAGLNLKQVLVDHLEDQGHDVSDLGTYSDEASDYPDFGAAVGHSVAGGDADYGICVCGTGIGIGIAANKVHGIRAAPVHDATSARLAKEHNDANVICVGARLVGSEVAKDIVDVFLASSWEAGRHGPRIEKLRRLEQMECETAETKQ